LASLLALLKFWTGISRKRPGMIVCHNHPSGSVEPDKEDIQVTERLDSAGQMLDIELRDYIIIGGKSYLSLIERLLW
jgi:DNA repair protein RadC